jgi:hypothetical protein
MLGWLAYLETNYYIFGKLFRISSRKTNLFWLSILCYLNWQHCLIGFVSVFKAHDFIGVFSEMKKNWIEFWRDFIWWDQSNPFLKNLSYYCLLFQNDRLVKVLHRIASVQIRSFLWFFHLLFNVIWHLVYKLVGECVC